MEIILRQDAISKGYIRYFTGNPCNRGHISERYVSNNTCVDCISKNQKSDKVKDYKRRHYQDNREYYIKKTKNNREKNIEMYRKLESDYQKRNLKKIIQKRKERMNNDSVYAMRERVRCLIKQSIRKKGYSKKTETYKILGCDYHEFKKHIEKQFTKGMSWDNRKEWHIDHIVPISSAKNEKEVIELNHFTNLRPMWACENIKKSNKMEYLI